MTSVHCQPRNTELRDSIIKIEFFFRLKSNENTFYGIVDPLVYFWPHVQRYIILCRQGSTPGEGGGVRLYSGFQVMGRRKVFFGFEMHDFVVFRVRKFWYN